MTPPKMQSLGGVLVFLQMAGVIQDTQAVGCVAFDPMSLIKGGRL
jgi:hypothetical protein